MRTEDDVIQEHDVIPLFLAACPSFRSVWEDHCAYWGDEVAGGYLGTGALAHHLIDLARLDHTGCFPRVFDLVEYLLIAGTDEVQTLATLGVLEGLQNVASNSGVDPETFFPWLGPRSRTAWTQLNEDWGVKRRALSRIGRVIRWIGRVIRPAVGTPSA